ncbi:MAG: HAMP domain-containing sensor histidine kinase [Planctomycetota bacterium]
MSDRAHGGRRRATVFVAAGLSALLVLLLGLQVRWLKDRAEAQEERTRDVLQSAADRIAAGIQTRYAEGVRVEAGELDRGEWGSEVLPELVREILGPAGEESFGVRILTEEAGAPPIYASPGVALSPESAPDVAASVPLLSVEPLEFGGGTWISEGPIFVHDTDGAAPPPQWRVEIRHRAGSLEAASKAAFVRSLALGAGLLVLLGGGGVFLWVAEQRARRLAEKELAFVAGVSHELRTPLAVLRTAGSNLASAAVRDPERVREYGALVEREAERLGAHVERVLRFAGGRDEAPRIAELDVAALVHEAEERCRPWRDRRDYRIEVEVAVEPGAEVARGDAAGLTSLLQNLLENAIKYGPEGQTIRVDARRGAGLRIAVTNPGEALPPADARLIFEPFQRGTRVPGDVPGSGLGLAVAARIAREHGGRLDVECAAGEVTFVLSIPAGGPAA